MIYSRNKIYVYYTKLYEKEDLSGYKMEVLEEWIKSYQEEDE
ncbi:MULTISPECIES: hypothetical protein [unclassified Clostridioides]